MAKFPTIEEFVQQVKERVLAECMIDGEPLGKLLDSGDLVHVCRCKDCKHRPIGGEAHNHTLIFPDEYCPCNCVDDNWYSWMPDGDWFCGNGERKDNER